MPQLSCPVCNKSFHVAPSNVTPVNCCSRECRYIQQRKNPKPPPSTEEICACGCGETFNRSQRTPNRLFKKGHGRNPAPRYIKKGKHNPKATKEVLCIVCGIEVPLKAKLRGQESCSHKCAMIRFKQNPNPENLVHCDHCNKPMYKPYCVRKKNKHFFCSVECRKHFILGENNPSYRHGEGRHIHYGNNWKSQRRAALERDLHCCQHCKKTPELKHRLHVHHITPAHMFDDRTKANVLTNLITLCHICHKKAEMGRIPIQRKIL